MTNWRGPVLWLSKEPIEAQYLNCDTLMGAERKRQKTQKHTNLILTRVNCSND